MEHCFFCGTSLCDSKARRYKQSSELQLFVSARCQPTPLAFSYITVFDGFPEESPICIPCVNWKRRTSARGHKVHVQVDQLICYILQPGRMGELDQRCVGRLLSSLQDPTNPFAPLIPLPAKVILSRLEALDLVSIGKAWWDLNGKTQFFRHAQTAKIIRAIQKGDDLNEGPSGE